MSDSDVVKRAEAWLANPCASPCHHATEGLMRDLVAKIEDQSKRIQWNYDSGMNAHEKRKEAQARAAELEARLRDVLGAEYARFEYTKREAHERALAALAPEPTAAPEGTTEVRPGVYRVDKSTSIFAAPDPPRGCEVCVMDLDDGHCRNQACPRFTAEEF